MRTTTALIALALSLPIGAPASAGPCVPMGLVPEVLTPAGTPIAAGGGIVVAAIGVGGGGVQTDASLQPDWRFRIAGKVVAPTPTALAPGLAVYALPRGAAGAVLEDAKHARVAELVAAPNDSPRLAAPAPTAATLPAGPSEPSPRGGANPSVTLELRAAAPAEAVALVVYGADGAPREWMAVSASTRYAFGRAPARCEARTPGQLPTGLGDRVSFAWIDRAGRPSAMSPVIEVKPTKP